MKVYLKVFGIRITRISVGVFYCGVAGYVMIAAPVKADMQVSHQLEVVLVPEENRLTATDTMDVVTNGQNELSFRLAGHMTDITVSVEGSTAAFGFKNDLLRVPIKGLKESGTIRVRVSYQGIFDDPVPIRPINAENPGYGVLGSISPRGTMLLPGAGWYPELYGARATYHLSVDAPEGIVAVSAGRSLGSGLRKGRTVSRWQVNHPIRGLALAAARYIVDKKVVEGMTAATYFLSGNRHLSEAYLAATARYLNLYSELFGPYPFQKFAVVENFFPTGYGFPSFTLLGSRVLRLPFIIHTSLGHEIAHCWWGNGVHVDPEGGNWSEGLTTYVADYLYKERESESAAQAYRQQMLRNYATLVDGFQDFPLKRFVSRTDPVTKSIGYDKSAMIFHMIRRRIGDAAFWSALRSLYREHLFKNASWEDFRRIFEAHGKLPLTTFFGQWVYGSGAPKLSLDGVRTAISDETWIVSGHIVQVGSFFEFVVPLVLETDAGRLQKMVAVTGPKTPFTFAVAAPPEKLVIDPDADLMRRLYPNEIPPSVNSLKGSESVLVVFADDIPEETAVAADILVRSLGHTAYRTLAESAMIPELLKQKDLLVVGYPGHDRLPIRTPPGISLRGDSISLHQSDHTGEDTTFFGIFHHPYDNDRVLALLLPFSNQNLQSIVRKITHYGRYSYLIFRNRHVQAKGIWPVTESPLIYQWPKSSTGAKGETAR